MIVVVNDANILIDLVKLKLLSHFFSLELKFYTTDLILNELHDWQIAAFEHYIKNDMLIIMKLTEVELLEVILLRSEKKQLSEQDCSAIVCAQKVAGTLVTSDKNLRNFAAGKTLSVVGHLWIFDKMIEEKTITPQHAIDKLKELRETVNTRLNLPKSACEIRIENWKRMAAI